MLGNCPGAGKLFEAKPSPNVATFSNGNEASCLTAFRQMTSNDSWLMERDAFLSMSPPRRVTQTVLKAANPTKGTTGLLIFGAIFLLAGLAFSWLFVPTHLPLQWKLEKGPVRSVPGSILSVEDTNLSINKVKVRKYRFSYQPDSGMRREGEAYTTGSRWNQGAEVSVRFLAADPALAVPEGARLGKGSVSGCFVLIFPLAGGAILLFTLRGNRIKNFLLQNGLVARATVNSLERTHVVVNNQNQYKIQLTRLDDHSGIVKRSHDRREIDLLEKKMSAGEQVIILLDPQKPKRLLFPETWNA
jgi:hypothetical protein